MNTLTKKQITKIQRVAGRLTSVIYAELGEKVAKESLICFSVGDSRVNVSYDGNRWTARTYPPKGLDTQIIEF